MNYIQLPDKESFPEALGVSQSSKLSRLPTVEEANELPIKLHVFWLDANKVNGNESLASDGLYYNIYDKLNVVLIEIHKEKKEPEVEEQHPKMAGFIDNIAVNILLELVGKGEMLSNEQLTENSYHIAIQMWKTKGKLNK